MEWGEEDGIGGGGQGRRRGVEEGGWGWRRRGMMR